MTNPVETLMTEHRLIEKVLGSLETFAAQLATGTDASRSTLSRYAEFFREFADRCHHGKEEDLLFVALTDHGMPREFGPIRVMLDEHDIGRSCVRELASAGEGSGELDAAELDRVRGAAARFVSMLRQHIQKEDNVLFPMASQSLPEPTVRELAEKFDTFEREGMGEGAQEKLHRLADALIAEYAPATAPAEFHHAGGCGGCHS